MPEIEIPKDKVDLENLGLINRGLFTVDGELSQKYNQVLKQVFDLDSDVDFFRIDKRGLSPELSTYFKKKYPERLEYGENYLNMRSANRFMVVISPDQKSAPLVAPQTSYEDSLFEEVYRQARHTIEDVTQSETLYGELEDGIEIYHSADDLLQFRTVELSLDTLESTIKYFFELKKMSDELGKGNNALDQNYIAGMQELVKKVGNIKHRSISKVFPITKEVHCFYVEFFKGVHCLRNFKNKDDIMTIFISHHQGTLKDYGEEIINIDLHDPELIDILHKYKFLKYDKDLIKKRIQEIEDETLLQEDIDVIDLKPHVRKRKIIENSPKFPIAWHELVEIAKIMENTSIKIEEAVEDKNYETRLKISTAASKPEIIDHILAELDPTDVKRVYEFNRRKFITEFPNLPLNRQRYIAYALLNNQGGNRKSSIFGTSS